MQHFVDEKLEFDACYIYEDVNRAIQHVHLSGLVHRGILSDPHRYLVKNVSLTNSVQFHCIQNWFDTGAHMFFMSVIIESLIKLKSDLN